MKIKLTSPNQSSANVSTIAQTKKNYLKIDKLQITLKFLSTTLNNFTATKR